MRKQTTYKKILNILGDLKIDYPSYGIGKHLATILDGQDIWGITDDEFLIAILEYRTELEMDDKEKRDDIQKIINDGMHLHDILEEDEEEFYE